MVVREVTFLRILFIDSNEILNNLLPSGFRQIGHEVKVIGDITPESLEQTMNQFNPNLLITEGWGMEQTVDRQLWIRQETKKRGIPHVYWSVEDPSFTDIFVRPLICRMEPDYVFTICKNTVKQFLKEGIRASHLDWSFNSAIHHLGRKQPQYRKDVVVVANAYKWWLHSHLIDYRFKCMKILILPLLKQGIRVDFWGHGWRDLFSNLGLDIPKHWIHRPIPYNVTRKVYHSAKIVLGLQNFRTQVTQRTYEVLASGGFLLTADTPAVRSIFRPGKDLVVSSSSDETLRLVHYYLKSRNRRRRIIRSGYHSVQRYCVRHRAEEMLQILYDEGIVAPN